MLSFFLLVFEEEKIVIHTPTKLNKTFPCHKFNPFTTNFYVYHSITEFNASTRIKNTNN